MNGRNYLLSNVGKYSRLEEKQNKKKATQRSETIPKNRINELSNRDARVPEECQSKMTRKKRMRNQRSNPDGVRIGGSG